MTLLSDYLGRPGMIKAYIINRGRLYRPMDWKSARAGAI